MATTHHADTRNALAEAIRTRANANTDACLIIGTSSLALPSTGVLCIIPLAAFGAASGGVTTSASNGNNAVAGAAGTAAVAIVANDSSSPAAAAEVFRGSVTATGGGGDVQISSTSLAVNDTVELTSNVTWTAPA